MGCKPSPPSNLRGWRLKRAFVISSVVGSRSKDGCKSSDNVVKKEIEKLLLKWSCNSKKKCLIKCSLICCFISFWLKIHVLSSFNRPEIVLFCLLFSVVKWYKESVVMISQIEPSIFYFIYHNCSSWFKMVMYFSLKNFQVY